MTTRTVTTQAELDAALAEHVDTVNINSDAGVWLNVSDSDSSSVVARGSSHVEASGSSHVEARDSSHVEAWDSSSVVAWGSSSVVARGSSHVVASKWTSVHLHSGRVALTGGVVIDHTKVDLTDPQTWCDYHGVTVTDGIATLYKAVNEQWTTNRGTDYSPGSTPEAPDWSDTDKCGGGLHFGPTPHHARDYYRSATRYLEVGVGIDELRPITGSGTAKAKARRVVRACVQVDEWRKPVSAVSA